ncbi:gfo/Idh/MocA family oxidoreductase [Ruminococcaceae bacterium OttesenSCG-928-D13]|nr:gfo/Idh/MocA family oxidoreductase [Ruminococcaceae bacterium OttesenSCG-928-D13]
MNFLIVGLGSMGKRRARLLAGLGHAVAGVDSAPARREEAAGLGITPHESLPAALAAGRYDAGLVCTGPLGHSGAITALLEAGLPVFTELNLVADGYAEAVALAKAKNLPLFVSNTMLYRAETAFIARRRAEFAKPVGYLYHIGQYLPDWHPWENYRDFFVGDARTGGVREIFAIELPWLCGAFGAARPEFVSAGTLSGLDLPYKDSVTVHLRHADGTRGVLAVDVVSPKAVRNFEVYGEGLQLFWEGSPASLFEYDAENKEKIQIKPYENAQRDPRYSDNIVENAYLDELLDFLRVLEGGTQEKWDPARDLEMIALMDEIESMEGGHG